MRKLINLEMKKFKLFNYFKGVAIANIVIMGLLVLIYFAEKMEGTFAFGDYEMAFAAIESIVRPVFTIFAAVLISRLIIEEYKTNSIMVLFMYPISRKKIMIAKLTIVACFTFFTIVLSNLLIGSMFYLVESFLHFMPEELTASALNHGLASMILGAIASSGMALIPLFFGMRKKSVPATIISAVIMVSLMNSSTGGASLFSFITIPLALAAIGCIIAYFAFRNIEKVDI